MTTDAAVLPAQEGRIGLAQASALYIAAVLGTGVLVLPGLAADAAGPASIVAVLILIGLSVPLAGTFAALASRHPDAGGVAHYARLALGPTAARAAGYWFLFGVQFGCPVVATLGGRYLGAALGLDATAQKLIGLAFLLGALLLGAVGLRLSGRVQLVLSAVLVAVVIGVIAVAAPASDPARLQPFLPHGWQGIAVAISLMVWAISGWEAVTHIAGEFRRPRRTIPVATVIAVVVVGAAYLALQIVTVMVLGGSRGSEVPLLDLVAARAPAIGPAVIAVIAAVLVLGVLNVYVPAFAKLASSLGRDGDLPRWFARGHGAGEVPRRGVLLTAVVSLGLYAVGALGLLPLEGFILIHTASMVAVYVVAMLAAVRLLPRRSAPWWMAIVALVLCLGLLVLAGTHLIPAAAMAVVAIGVTLYRRRRRERSATSATGATTGRR